jgi:hypothetical protein
MRYCGEKSRTAIAKTCVAAPQQQIAAPAERPADRREVGGVLLQSLDRERARGEAHFASAAMGNDVDGPKVGAAVQCHGHLPCGGLRRVKQDCLDFGAQAGHEGIEIPHGAVDEGDFFDADHGVTSECDCRLRRFTSWG